MSLRHFSTSSAGIQRYFRDDGDDKYSIIAVSDSQDILDLNKAMRNENTGWSSSKDLRRCASIPLIIVFKWLNEEGWNALDPNYEDKLRQKLNDPDWAYLRTADWRV